MTGDPGILGIRQTHLGKRTPGLLARMFPDTHLREEAVYQGLFHFVAGQFGAQGAAQ